MDREKVIAWLADEELYYRDHGDTHNSLMACDAIALLKEQEAEIAFLKAMQLQTVHNMSNEDIGNAVRNVLRL